jgi:hypothetical protein
MRRLLLLAFPILLVALASDAQAATDTETLARALGVSTAQAEVESSTAANAMGVSRSQATEDLVVQHEAFQTIGEMIETGSQVWFDNKTATVHVYRPSTSVTIPAAVASHVVNEAAPRTFPASSTVGKAAGCGTSRSSEEFCSPIEAGEKIKHSISGGPKGDCTAGFMVRDYSGNPYILTAGHCSIWGTTFYENPFTSKAWPGLMNCTVGPWVHGASPWSGYDAAIMPVTGCEGVIPYIHNWETGVDTHQEGATDTQFVGEYVCHWGLSTKSLHACGTIFAVNVPSKINYSKTGSGEWTIQQTDQICAYGQPGDSGGPVTDGTYTGDATGIMLAFGTDFTDCPQGNGALIIEQRIFTVLGLFNVYVAAS